MILFRYLTREVYTTLSVVIGVLLLIFLSNQFVRYLAQAAAGKIGIGIVLKIMALQIPSLLGLLLPIGLFLAILLAYGRLYADNEMTVMTCSGFSKTQLVSVTLLFSTLIMVLVGWLSCFVSPELVAYRERLKNASEADSLIQTLIPGRFHVTPDGHTVYYIENTSYDHKAVNNIFIARWEKNKEAVPDPTMPPGKWSVTAAQSGYQAVNKDSGDKFVVAVKGNRYFGFPGDKDFRLMKFDKYAMRLNTETPETRLIYQAMTNQMLWDHRDKANAMAELQWRWVMPLSVPIVSLLALSLSRLKPRQGRFAKLLPSILIYTIYANLLFAARSWVERGLINSYLGMWWLPGCLLLLALFMLIDKGTWARLRRSCYFWRPATP